MRKIKLLLEYDGTRYSGWQSQRKGKAAITIQEEIEKQLKKLLKSEEASVVSAGRTDAGVHALEQVAAFRAGPGFRAPAETVKKALNAMLPGDIRVIEASDCPAGFHPRHDAVKKTYFYLIAAMPHPPVFVRPFSWGLPYKLDLGRMREAAALIVGRNDFSSFRASGCGAKTPVKDLLALEITRLQDIEFMTVRLGGDFIRIRLTADAFLRHMARNIVGTLAEAGRGRIEPGRIRRIIESRDRRLAGPAAPARGLFLER
ncbi:MAG: tRNA pseudouridine(38-40) synthase TruA, partial [Nitrospiraceae bacterium]|nr:tRNA pseudouridine(38-40) synthase TruA [Nitrospiraceae bacterium]